MCLTWGIQKIFLSKAENSFKGQLDFWSSRRCCTYPISHVFNYRPEKKNLWQDVDLVSYNYLSFNYSYAILHNSQPLEKVRIFPIALELLRKKGRTKYINWCNLHLIFLVFFTSVLGSEKKLSIMVISDIYFTYQDSCPSFSFCILDLQELPAASMQQKY